MHMFRLVIKLSSGLYVGIKVKNTNKRMEIGKNKTVPDVTLVM